MDFVTFHLRVVPLNAAARACVEKQLVFNQSRGLSVAPAAPLFQNSQHGPLSVRSVQKLIARYRVAAGLEVKATPHTLRHSNASALHRAGVPRLRNVFDLRVIQAGLGHRHLSATERYLGVGPVEMSEAYSAIGG